MQETECQAHSRLQELEKSEQLLRGGGSVGWEDSIDEENEEGLWVGVFRSVEVWKVGSN